MAKRKGHLMEFNGIELDIFEPSKKIYRTRWWGNGENALADYSTVTLVGYIDENEGPNRKLHLLENGPIKVPNPAVIIVRRRCNLGPILRVLNEPKGSRMFGGLYAASSDSRFRECVGEDFYGAVAIHDRYER